MSGLIIPMGRIAGVGRKRHTASAFGPTPFSGGSGTVITWRGRRRVRRASGDYGCVPQPLGTTVDRVKAHDVYRDLADAHAAAAVFWEMRNQRNRAAFERQLAEKYRRGVELEIAWDAPSPQSASRAFVPPDSTSRPATYD